MGGQSNMTCVNMIYYHLVTWLGDRGLNSQDYLRSGSLPNLGKHPLCRQQRQDPDFNQVCGGTLTLDRW